MAPYKPHWRIQQRNKSVGFNDHDPYGGWSKGPLSKWPQPLSANSQRCQVFEDCPPHHADSAANYHSTVWHTKANISGLIFSSCETLYLEFFYICFYKLQVIVVSLCLSLTTVHSWNGDALWALTALVFISVLAPVENNTPNEKTSMLKVFLMFSRDTKRMLLTPPMHSHSLHGRRTQKPFMILLERTGRLL